MGDSILVLEEVPVQSIVGGNIISEDWTKWYKDGPGGRDHKMHVNAGISRDRSRKWLVASSHAIATLFLLCARRIRVNVRLRPGHGLPHGTRVELGADIFFEDGTRVQEQYQVR